MHHFEEENTKIFLETGPSPDPTPVGDFGASIRVSSALKPPQPHFWLRAWDYILQQHPFNGPLSGTTQNHK